MNQDPDLRAEVARLRAELDALKLVATPVSARAVRLTIEQERAPHEAGGLDLRREQRIAALVEIGHRWETDRATEAAAIREENAAERSRRSASDAREAEARRAELDRYRWPSLGQPRGPLATLEVAQAVERAFAPFRSVSGAWSAWPLIVVSLVQRETASIRRDSTALSALASSIAKGVRAVGTIDDESAAWLVHVARLEDIEKQIRTTEPSDRLRQLGHQLRAAKFDPKRPIVVVYDPPPRGAPYALCFEATPPFLVAA